MRTKLKGFIIITICVILVFIVSACSEQTPPQIESTPPQSAVPPPAEDDTAIITVVTSYGGDDGNRQNYERAMYGFEAKTGHIVNDNSEVSSEAWKIKVLESFDNGTEPDVLFFFAGVDSNSLVESGKVVSIETIRESYPDYASNMKDSMLPKSPLDGQSYAVPVNGYWEGLFVNKKVLEDCGVSIPDENTTWEQFLNDCQTIADKGYIPIAASLAEIPHYWFEFCVFNNGSLDTHQRLPETASDDIGSIWTAGLEDIKTLYERGFFPENTGEMTSTEADTLVAENKAAFMIDGSWKMGWFSENAADINSFTVTYVPGKSDRKATDIIGGLSMGYFITKQAWDNPVKQAACVEFIKEMTRDDIVATFGATAVTALVNGIEPPEGSNNLVKDALEMTKNCTGITVAVADSLFPDARADLFSGIIDVARGTVPASDAIDRALSINN